MKARKFLVAAIVVAAVSVFGLSPFAYGGKYPYVDVPVTYDGPTIKARFGIYLGPSHHMYYDGWKSFTTLVNERSKGKIAVKEYLGGVLFKAREGFKAIQDDICDFAPAYPNYSPTGFNLSFGASLPFMWENAYVAGRCLEELYAKYFKSEYERLGCKLLTMSATSNYHMFSKKPITKLEQLKGMKVRSAGGMINKVLERFGMVPVSVPSPEIYTTLQRGMVDACIFSWASANSYKLYEVTDYVTQIGPGFFVFGPASGIVNPRWLAKLPPDLKKIVYGAAREAGFHICNTYEKEAVPSMKKHKEHGVKVLSLSDSELARWKEASQPVVDEWIEKLEGKGVPARQLIKDMRALNEKYKKVTAEAMLELQKSNPVPMSEIW
jgi:TRAP-type C4-dicarboxylate transport system substrate-binding protein